VGGEKVRERREARGELHLLQFEERSRLDPGPVPEEERVDEDGELEALLAQVRLDLERFRDVRAAAAPREERSG